MSSLTITNKLLKTYEYGHNDWVEQYIKYYAREFQNGVSVDKIIDWTDSDHTSGNNFQNVKTFYNAMFIAHEKYSISVPYFPQIRFKDMTLTLAKVILDEYKNCTAEKLTKKYYLYNRNVVYHLKRDLYRKGKRLSNVLTNLNKSK